MAKWEYKVLKTGLYSADDLEQVLPALGQEGWELIGEVPVYSAGTAMIFKRPAKVVRKSVARKPKTKPKRDWRHPSEGGQAIKST